MEDLPQEPGSPWYSGIRPRSTLITRGFTCFSSCRAAVAFQCLGAAQAWNALGLLGLCRGYHSSARIQFEESLQLLADLGDDRWTPVVRMRVAECMAGVALYREATEVLAEALAVFRERSDAGREAEALRLLGSIRHAVECGLATTEPDDPG